MALKIKNEETQKLAHELSRLTGESTSAAVTDAIRERLDRVRNQQGAGLADCLLKIDNDCASHLHEPCRSIDHAKLLYEAPESPNHKGRQS